ncbi:hypothetical protein [Streptomyces sp. NPDC088752]
MFQFDTTLIGGPVEATEDNEDDMDTIMYGRNVNHAEVVLV